MTPKEEQNKKLNEAIERLNHAVDNDDWVEVGLEDLRLVLAAATLKPELEARVNELTKERDVLRQDIQYILSEISGIHMGLMMHPNSPDHNNFCITIPSKEKLNAILELINRYGQSTTINEVMKDQTK